MSTDLNSSTFSFRDRPFVGVIGSGECDARLEERAERLGRALGRMGAVVVCGGLSGVMAAVCRGAKFEGGFTIGVLPGSERRAANPYVDCAIATGMGEARNLIIIRTADILVAVGGSYGTLSELGFALKMGKRVLGIDTWEIPGVQMVNDIDEVIRLIKEGGENV